jgi:hypothetical protein
MVGNGISVPNQKADPFQAAAAAVRLSMSPQPSLISRTRYRPSWRGPSEGRLRVTRLFSPTRSMRTPSWMQISPRQIPD